MGACYSGQDWLASLGLANGLRPWSAGSTLGKIAIPVLGEVNLVGKWDCDFAQNLAADGTVTTPKPGTPTVANGQGYWLNVTLGGRSIQSPITPQQIFDQVKAKGQTLLYIEFWQATFVIVPDVEEIWFFWVVDIETNT